MSHKLRLPHYFAVRVSRQIAELYVSTAIADLALSIVLVFEPIFLYSVLGFTVQQVLIFFAAVYGFYIVFIPWGAKIVSRFGYEHGIFFSIPFQILYWLLLFGSQTNFNLIYLAPVVLAIEKSLFWPAFHSSVARFARDQQRGREFSIFHAIVNIVQVLGPLAGGIIAQHFGLRVTFAVAAAIYFCSFIPLFTTKEIFVPKIYQFKDTWKLFKTYPKKFLGYVGFGEELLVLTVWPIFIYIIVKNYESTGILTTIAALVATILALYIGKVTDNYSKRLLIKVGTFLYFIIWLARFVATSFWSVFFVDSLSRTSKELVFIPLSTVTYERAEATHILPYVVFFEQALSIGKLVACILGIVLFTFTGSFYALFALAGLVSLLYILI